MCTYTFIIDLFVSGDSLHKREKRERDVFSSCSFRYIGQREGNVLTTHSVHFIYGYMALYIW